MATRLGYHLLGYLLTSNIIAMNYAMIKRRPSLQAIAVVTVLSIALHDTSASAQRGPQQPYLVVLGISQDGGTPQAGTKQHAGWTDPKLRRLATSVAVIDPSTSQRWLFEATPDLRLQLHRLDVQHPTDVSPGIDGVFLTHAHIGHYAGLMFFGHESMGAKGIPVYAMPRMRHFIETNGPWDQLVRYENIKMEDLAADSATALNERLFVTPFLVPHRQEYSEVVGFRIDGPSRSVTFLPDIDSWAEWDERGTRLEDVIAGIDVAYVDATFFANGEIPGRDMSGFPHPFIVHTMDRLRHLAAAERAKVRFIHLNHTNPALWKGTDARKHIEAAGFRVAEELETVEL